MYCTHKNCKHVIDENYIYSVLFFLKIFLWARRVFFDIVQTHEAFIVYVVELLYPEDNILVNTLHYLRCTLYIFL